MSQRELLYIFTPHRPQILTTFVFWLASKCLQVLFHVSVFFNVFLQEAGNKGLNICSFLDSAWDSQRVDVLRWTGLTVQAAELLAHPTPPGAAPVDFVRIHLVHLLVRRVVRRPAEEGAGGENLLLLCSHGTRFQIR